MVHADLTFPPLLLMTLQQANLTTGQLTGTTNPKIIVPPGSIPS